MVFKLTVIAEKVKVNLFDDSPTGSWIFWNKFSKEIFACLLKLDDD